MNFCDAAIKYTDDIPVDIFSHYQDADKYIYININDEDLQKFRIEMPEPPDWKEIEGFGLPYRDQRFQYEQYPADLKALEREVRSRVLRNKKKTDSNFSIERDIQDGIWDELETHSVKHAKLIEWIRKQWSHRIYGKWYFIKGKPYYVCGWNWMYLNYYSMEGGTGQGSLPEFRYRDWKWFHAQQYAATTNETVDCDDDGNVIVLDDGTLKMRKMSTRTVVGTNNLKGRRVGDSSKTGNIDMDEATGNIESINGLQADTEENARKIYERLIKYPFLRLPFFFKPKMPSLNIASQISLMDSNLIDGLNSIVDYRASGETKYDGSRVNLYWADECFGKDTKVLMFNGETKNIQDIVVGDFLIGEDGKRKRVLNTVSGIDEMYYVEYKKGTGFACNGDHILQTYYSRHEKTVKKEIKVRDFFNKPYSTKKANSMYKSNGVYFKKEKHVLDPYFVGLFIGAGLRNDIGICSVDNEIIKYCHSFASKHGCKIVTRDINHNFIRDRSIVLHEEDTVIGVYDNYVDLHKKTGISRSMCVYAEKKNNGLIHGKYRIESRNGNNIIKQNLKKLGLLEEKIIPKEYLIDSYDNRMMLLAGIIDSDGYLYKKKGNPYGYEITQNSEKTSNDIVFLAQSLGFYATCNSKKASMKRSDGTTYKNIVYRVCIYGDLYKIPCIVERKKANRFHYHKNRRNPLRFGFNVIKTGIDRYYGVTVDGGSFLLNDFTVVHNCGKTLEANTLKRHEIVIRTLTPGAKINGLMIYTSTAEEMDADAGKNFEEITLQSMFDKRGVDGRTKSGLINIYFSIEESFEGFIDPWGFPIIDNPTDPDVINSMAIIEKNDNGEVMGVREYLIRKEEEFVEQEDLVGLSSFQRKNPKSFRECFSNASHNLFFNRKILTTRLTQIKFNNNIRVGNLINTGNDIVEFIDDPNGRFKFSMQLDGSKRNLMINQGRLKRPRYNDIFVASCDTYRVSQTDSRRKSLGSGAVRWKFDKNIDTPDKDISERETGKFVCTYLYRPDTLDEYCQDMLNMCIYWGALMYPENNIPVVQEYFVRNGYSGYLLHDVDSRNGKLKVNAGWTTGGKGGIKDELFNIGADWVNLYASECKHPEILQEFLQIRSLDNMKDRDLFVSVVGCLKAEQSLYVDYVRKSSTDRISLDGWYPT